MINNKKLALLGGSKTVVDQLKPYRSMGDAERAAIIRVMDTDCISGFYGSPGEKFLGGPMVRGFEDAWCDRFGCNHAVSVNSATSGLIAAIGAVGIGPGDEVIVPPYTMSATVIAPLFYGAIPVFVDIEADTFCLDPAVVLAAITPRTRAILAVNLFGHPAQLLKLRKIADEAGIFLIEDSSQSPLGHEHGQACGTIGHIGVFSFNYHKHIHTGEGGMVITNDPDIAKRLQLIRNHGENIVESWGMEDITNLIGMNLRMTELSAAIGLEQLKNIEEHVENREQIAESLSRSIKGLKGLTAPVVQTGCRHNYYCWVMKLDEAQLGIRRSTFSNALLAEGFPHGQGYVRPLYHLPVFQQQKAIGHNDWPFSESDYQYNTISCPVTERMYKNEVLLFEPCAYALEKANTVLLGQAIIKVHQNLAQLAEWEQIND